MSERIATFDTPKRGSPPVRCKYCGSELEATGEYYPGQPKGSMRWFVWRHVETQLVTCTTTHDADVHNDWQATLLIEHADTG